MPSFDIVSRFNYAELDNAINNMHKMIASRFDFRGATVEVEVNKKDKKIKIVGDDGTKMRGIREMFETSVIRRGIEAKAFEWGENEGTSLGKLKCELKIRDGIEQELAKQIVKAIKDSKLKVQASIQGEELRVTAKQIDDLQLVMKLVKEGGFGIPLQFVNMKS